LIRIATSTRLSAQGAPFPPRRFINPSPDCAYDEKVTADNFVGLLQSNNTGLKELEMN
jgi:hypothetical protein